MTYTTALAAPPRFQWESSSGTFSASQSNNCGPTCMAFIAGFYRDRSYGIEALRRLVVGCCVPTDITAQRDMLYRVGVPAEVYNVASLAALKQILSSGRRPTGLRIYMGRVPYTYRGHSFTGWHEVVAIANGTRNGVSGIWINDPNFSPPGGIRPDPMHGHRFYPDWVINSAFIQPKPAYAIVPVAAKKVTTATAYVYFNAGVNGVNLRTAPDARKANVYAVIWADPKGIRRLNGVWIGHTSARRTLYATVKGADGYTYNKLRLAGTGLYTYVQSRFMHR